MFLCCANQPLRVFRGEVWGALKHGRRAEASEGPGTPSRLWRYDHPLPAADAHAAAIDLDAQLTRLAVPIGGRRFDAEEIVGGGLAQDPVEGEIGGPHRNVDEAASGRLGEVAQPGDGERPLDSH